MLSRPQTEILRLIDSGWDLFRWVGTDGRWIYSWHRLNGGPEPGVTPRVPAALERAGLIRWHASRSPFGGSTAVMTLAGHLALRAAVAAALGATPGFRGRIVPGLPKPPRKAP